jgi:dienelactone hydrolase
MFPRILIALVSLVFLIAGCGGDSSVEEPNEVENAGAQTPNDTNQVNKAKFVDAANAICVQSRRQMQERITALAERPNDKGTVALAPQLVDEIVAPGLEAEIRKIQTLPVPPDDTKQVQAILAVIQKTVDEAKANPTQLTAKARPFAEAERVANRYGLTACGRV